MCDCGLRLDRQYVKYHSDSVWMGVVAMELKDLRKGLRVWVVNESKIPPGESQFGVVQRVHEDFAGNRFLRISVLLDGGGTIIGGLKPEDLDFE